MGRLSSNFWLRENSTEWKFKGAGCQHWKVQKLAAGWDLMGLLRAADLPRYSTLNAQRSTLNTQHSTLNTQHSTGLGSRTRAGATAISESRVACTTRVSTGMFAAPEP